MSKQPGPEKSLNVYLKSRKLDPVSVSIQVIPQYCSDQHLNKTLHQKNESSLQAKMRYIHNIYAWQVTEQSRLEGNQLGIEDCAARQDKAFAR